MALIEVCMQLRIERPACRPDVRIWVDLLAEDALDSEVELPLRRRAGYCWTGAFTLPEIGRRSFLYRAGVVAHPGASWALLFRDRGCGQELLSDADLLATRKAWLTGDCDVPAGETRGRRRVRPRSLWGDSPRDRTAHAAKLRLWIPRER